MRRATNHHGQPVGHRAHPLEMPVAQVLRPQPLRGVGGELLNGTDPLGRQLGDEHLAVRRMCRVVGGGEHVGGSAERIHFERHDGALWGVRHGRGQVRGEILGTTDDLVDRVPAAHGVEPGITDAVDGAPRRASGHRADTDPVSRRRRRTRPDRPLFPASGACPNVTWTPERAGHGTGHSCTGAPLRAFSTYRRVISCNAGMRCRPCSSR